MGEPLHAGALDALGDANRRAILEVLARGPRSVQQIADELPVSRPAVSRHLRLLKNAGLVADEATGTRRVYTLRGAGVEAVREYFELLWGEAGSRFRLIAENTGHLADNIATAASVDGDTTAVAYRNAAQRVIVPQAPDVATPREGDRDG